MGARVFSKALEKFCFGVTKKKQANRLSFVSKSPWQLIFKAVVQQNRERVCICYKCASFPL